MEQLTKKQKVQKLLEMLSPEFKEIVKEIENSIPTTKNHYSNYMALLSKMSGGDKEKAKLYSLCLVKAGANTQGVADALNLL